MAGVNHSIADTRFSIGDIVFSELRKTYHRVLWMMADGSAILPSVGHPLTDKDKGQPASMSIGYACTEQEPNTIIWSMHTVNSTFYGAEIVGHYDADTDTYTPN